MGLPAGARVGPYEITGTLGAGGMGEVYRARDSRLGRDVAVKALPSLALTDPERVSRFQREARTLAALNHPHIASIYELEEYGGSQYLILELVEGGTLADRLGSGPVPLREALTIARQVADALAAAHEKGIIHRDLKPANVALTSDGQAKVLDFGLAKALARDADAPAVTATATRSGVVLGTAAYMSPEQARGLPLDKRTDIWAFGCVLYELLTGRHPFPGETISDVIVAILGREPDWPGLPAGTPPRIQGLVRRCLEKDLKRRLHDIADARIELDDALAEPAWTGGSPPAGLAPAGAVPRATRERLAWAVAAASVTALAAVVLLGRSGFLWQIPADPRTYRTSVVLPPGLTLSGGTTLGNYAGRFAVSPDGRRLAVVAASSDGNPMLWLRPLDALVAHPLAGTEGASFPFWSPDSRFIGFLAGGKLKTIDAAGGAVNTVADATLGAAGTWNRDNVILFTPAGGLPIHRVSASGGAPTPVTTLNEADAETQHWFPYFLPDGRHFLYFVVGSRSGGITDPRAVHVGSIDPGFTPRALVEGGSNAKYAQGHLLFLRGTTLLAQPFDPARLELSGEPRPITEGVQMAGGSATGVAGAFTVSDTGVIAYQTGLEQVRSELVWFDRSGTRLSVLGERADYAEVSLSRDGSHAAVSVLDPARGTRDLWIYDIARGIRERLTFHEGDDFAPVWSPDGERIVYSSRRGGAIDLYQKLVSGAGGEDAFFKDSLGKFLADWSRDSRHIVYVAGGGIVGRSDVWILPLYGPRQAYPLLDTPMIETQGQFSPDGKWLAFTSRESTQRPFEVVVMPFPTPGRRVRVSAAGGRWPRWSREGSEIVYLAPDSTLMSAPLTVTPKRLDVGAVRPLFKIHPRPMVRLDAYPYAIAPDGRLLVNTFVDDTTPTDITLVVNWAATLGR